MTLLNSTLLDFIYKTICTPQAGGYYAYKTQFLKHIPIILGSKYTCQRISKLGRTIEERKKESPTTDTTTFENEIDLLVYKLYGLTYEEVKIVDPDIEKIISEEDYNTISAIKIETANA